VRELPHHSRLHRPAGAERLYGARRARPAQCKGL